MIFLIFGLSLLSLGAVYAFIPIIIVIILILAARGAVGRDFFETFGISQLAAYASGLGSGGSGKGISGTAGKKGKAGGYKTSTKKTTDATKGMKGAIKGAKKKITEQKTKLLNDMQPEQLRNMLAANGTPLAETANWDRETLVLFASANLSGSVVGDYFERNIASQKPPGQPGPLQQPRPGGMAGLGMAIKDVPAWYKSYSMPLIQLVGGGRQLKHSQDVKTRLSATNNTQLKNAIKQSIQENAQAKGQTPVIPPGLDTMSKEALVSLAIANMTYGQYNKYIFKGQPVGSKSAASSSTPGGSQAKAAGSAAASSVPGGGNPTDSAGTTPGPERGSNDPKLNMLEEMTPEEINHMFVHFGIQPLPTSSKDNLVAYAYTSLTPKQIKEYYTDVRGSTES